MRNRQAAIPVHDFVKALAAVAKAGGTMADVGTMIGRSEDYVVARISNVKANYKSLAPIIDKLEIERKPVGRKKVDEKTLIDILSGTIG